jgi:hypothetical protein
MKAYVTSIGESTTDLCVWSLERQGFEVVLIKSASSLWSKLKEIYEIATDDFIRVDADVIVNRNVKELIKQDQLWWYQSYCFGWYSQDIVHGGIQFIRQKALNTLRSRIVEAERLERPESWMFRLEQFHNPRVCGTFEKICGIHGYKQTDDKRVYETKARRGQLDNYDFELAERLNEL